ncbi:MAG: NUDIX domain-containing protein [bacterium]
MSHAILPIAVHLFLIKDEKVFLMQRAGTGFKDGEWSVPAGRLDAGESVKKATVRESKEEVNAEVDINNIGEPLVMHHQDERGERLYFFFVCYKWNGDLKNLESEKCAGVEWFEIDKLPKNTVLHVAAALKAKMLGETYMEYGFK